MRGNLTTVLSQIRLVGRNTWTALTKIANGTESIIAQVQFTADYSAQEGGYVIVEVGVGSRNTKHFWFSKHVRIKQCCCGELRRVEELHGTGSPSLRRGHCWAEATYAAARCGTARSPSGY